MFRVSKTEDRLRTVITVDGQLSRESVDVVESCCDQGAARGKPVHLLLREVTAIDQAGRALLGRLAAKGVRLIASDLYASYVVRTLTSARHAGGRT